VSRDTSGDVPGLRVLIVDDDPDVLAFFAEVFQQHGCRVATAPTAERALAWLGHEPVDLVVSDIKLPGLSGLELLRAVPHTPVVLITGQPSIESAACGARHHAYDYLTKPVSVEDLARLIKRVRADRQRAHPAGVVEDLADRRFRPEALRGLGQLVLEGREPAVVFDRVLADASRALRVDAGLLVHRAPDGTFTHGSRGHGPVLDALPLLLRAALPTLIGTEACAWPIAPPAAPVAAIAALVPWGRGAILLAVGRDARGGAFLLEDQAFLLGYARMAALALDRLVVTERIESQVLDTVGTLVRALEARDPALRGHAARVSLYAGEIATQLRLAGPQLLITRRAGLLHDLGKLSVADAVLRKPGPLTPAEYGLVRRHPLAAEGMLRRLPALAAEATVVRNHTERYDGTGYPDGRKGAAIPLPARIIAVADAFDAMTSPRPYRVARPVEAVRAEIVRHAGSQFDPRVTAAFSAIPDGRLAEMSRFYRSADEERVA